jgi:cob(I)alamin adenosyltransferase
MKIYTRKGDDGSTSLVGGKRVPKHDIRVEAYGSVDELISWVGLLRDHPENKNHQKLLIYIQEQLMICAASLASDPENPGNKLFSPDPDCVTKLENEIDRLEGSLKPLTGFIIPGGHILVSYCHITRCVCRRAERSILRLNRTEKTPEIINKFINRLSDYFFVLSRNISLNLDIEEVKWSV